MTPEEAWSGVNPSIHHFKVFGFATFMHIPYVRKKRLDVKSTKSVHLGVNEESKA